jgi:hypothetical protein
VRQTHTNPNRPQLNQTSPAARTSHIKPASTLTMPSRLLPSFLTRLQRTKRAAKRTPRRPTKRTSVSARNPSFGGEGQVDVMCADHPVILVCGSGDGVTLLREVLTNQPYCFKITDNPANCTHVILVASKGVFEHKRTRQALDQTLSADKQFMVLFETDKAVGGALVEYFLERLPNSYGKLKEGEWVPLYHSDLMFNASVLTALRQRNLGPHQQMDKHFAFFLSHQQAKAQGNMMTLATTLHKIGLKVWLDMLANDLSTQGMMDGVNNSEHFVLFCTDGYFTRPYCLMELDQAILLNKPIVVLYEERERFGGAALDKLLAQVPDKYSFLTAKHDDESLKHGWIRLAVRDEFQQQMIEQLLKHCDIPPPNHEVLAAFAKVPDCTALMQQNQASFLAGTRGWMFDAVEQWRANIETGSHVFGILGKAGVGKSVFAAQLALGHDRVVAHHFFKHNDDGHLTDAKMCIWSLAKQLRGNVPGFRRAFDEGIKKAESVTEWTLQECFSRLIAKPAQLTPDPGHGERVLVVVDAIDECDERFTMLSVLKDEWRTKVPAWLSLLFTTRPSVMALPETEAEASAQGVAVLAAEDPDNVADVQCYLTERVFTTDRVLDPLLAAKFVDAVTVKSEGSFQYLHWLDVVIADMLKRGQRTRLLESDVDALPDGLSALYKQHFGGMREYNAYLRVRVRSCSD